MTGTFEFSIVASGLDPEAEDFEARFYEAGCDDATVSFQKGHVIVDFSRRAESIEEALASALEAVRRAGARIDRIEPDPLVSLSDVAARSGLTRAAMTLYAKGRRGRDFPPPVARVTTDSPLWDWAAVARWLHERGQISQEAAREAAAMRAANDAVGSGRAAKGLVQAKEYGS